MKKQLFLVVAAILIIFTYSINTMATGMDSLVVIPTADLISSKGQIRGEIGTNSNRVIEASFLVQSQFQVGGGVVFNKFGDSELGVNGKILLASEGQKEPAIAAGMINDDIYIVASKNFNYGLRGHLGFGNGGFGGLFLGINKTLNAFSVESDEEGGIPPINIMADYNDGGINLGIKVDVQQNLAFELGLLDLKNLRAGLVYSF